MTPQQPERQGLIAFMMSLDAHQTRLQEVQDKLDEADAENEKLEAEIEHLKHRLTYLEKLIAREKKRAADELRQMEARIVETLRQEMGADFVPRSMFYRNNAVLHALALAQWPNEDDRPPDFDEVVSINDGYQEFGVDYVRY